MTISYAAARNAPLLEFEDERLLIRNWQRTKDSFALEKLLMSHARIVFFWARKLSADKTEQEELVSEGIMGLIRAADMFDLGRDVRFSTYARWWVKNSVLTALTRLRSVVEAPAGAPAPTTVITGGNTEEGMDFDRLPSDDPTPEEQVIAKSAQDQMRQQISEALRMLDPLDREVVLSRTLRQPPESIGVLAKRLEVSTAKLRQVERRAMLRLRNELMARGVISGRMQ